MGTWLHNNWPKNYHVTHSQWKIMTKWNLQIIYARNLNYSSHWWKKCQLIKIFKINGFKLYQIYVFSFCVEFKKPEIFCCWCVLESVVLYEGMINIVILPYLSRLLVLIQNVDELSSRLTDWHSDTSYYTFASILAKSSRHFMGKIKLNKNLKLPTWIKIVL